MKKAIVLQRKAIEYTLKFKLSAEEHEMLKKLSLFYFCKTLLQPEYFCLAEGELVMRDESLFSLKQDFDLLVVHDEDTKEMMVIYHKENGDDKCGTISNLEFN